MDAFHWLLYLTFLYAAILVAALAAGLIAILRALMVIRKNLAAIKGGLVQVAAQTEPLGGSLQSVNTALAQTSGGLLVLLQHLQDSDSSLGRLVTKLMVGR